MNAAWTIAMAALWVIAGAAVVVIFAVLFLRFWLHLDSRYRVLFLASAVLYLAGVFGKEITASPSMGLTFSLILTVEQALQYAGVTLLIYSLLLYMTTAFPRFFESSRL